VEEGQLSLDDPIGRFDPSSTEPSATVRQILTHTSAGPAGLVFAYRPDRLGSLAFVIRTCTGASFRAAVVNLLDRLAMVDSVPGSDVTHLVPPADGVSPQGVARYTSVLGRLAIPYAVDTGGHATLSQYAPITLTPHDGLISTVLDFAKFDLALRSSVLLQPETLTAAWRAPLDDNRQPLPHGMGWFVQMYKGERIVWQFGLDANASSSLVVTVPSRGYTVILLANSDGLVKGFGLAGGDLAVSPFGRVVLGLLVG
jgi:CubicO group peptidase (beta-lactamase class C family)